MLQCPRGSGSVADRAVGAWRFAGAGTGVSYVRLAKKDTLMDVIGVKTIHTTSLLALSRRSFSLFLVTGLLALDM